MGLSENVIRTEDLPLVLPHLKKRELQLKGGLSGKDQTWELHYYGDDQEVLFREEAGESILRDSVKEELERYIIVGESSFRTQICLETSPYLLGVFFDDKILRLCTCRLNDELFLLQEMAPIAGKDEAFSALRTHTEHVASLLNKEAPSIIEQVGAQEGLIRLDDDRLVEVEKNAEKITEKLLVKVNEYHPSLFERVSDVALGLTAKYALLRIHLLKFVAILPSLDHDQKGHEVKRILLETLRRLDEDNQRARVFKKKGQWRSLPKWLMTTLLVVQWFARLLPAGVLSWTVRFSVRTMAKRFIAGETIETAEKSFRDLFGSGRDVTLDQLGELVVSEKEADHYCEEVLKLINGFDQHVPRGQANTAGINRAHVSIKVSALCSDFRPEAFENTYAMVAPRLGRILSAAKEKDVFLNIDAEHYHYRDMVLRIYEKILLEKEEFKGWGGTGIVLQAYLRDASRHLDQIINLAKKRGVSMPVRLVKGAYWDAETVEADAHAFNAPEFLNKEETDIHFRQLLVRIMQNHAHVQLCIASHNFADHAYAESLREKMFPDHPVVEHQCLHMTYEALSVAMAEMGWVVRNYVPIGSLLVGMAYLVRRIMENSSQVGVLTIMRSHKKKTRLVPPQEVHSQKAAAGELVRDIGQSQLTHEFFNVTPVRTYLEDQLVMMKRELRAFGDKKLGRNYPNAFHTSGENWEITSSSDPSLVVGTLRAGAKNDAKKAVDVSYDAYKTGVWSKAPWAKRSAVMLAAAREILARRLELSALIVYEAGKAVGEALADVDEAIDFLRFYAREEGRCQKKMEMTGSRGVTLVISPWNFPLAIPCGMVSSSLVTGNTVILKSAEQTPLIAQVMTDIFHRAGVPKDHLIHLPGLGEEVGEALTDDERIALCIFTGSKAVGLHLAHKLGSRMISNPLTGQRFPVRAISEMGGKNAIVVTANAELDEAVAGILYSAFGHAGQKCSAASRILVDASVKDRLVERLKEAIGDMEVGVAWDFSIYINPVISAEDKKRLQDAVAQATIEAQRTGGVVHVDRTKENFPGHAVGPALIELPFDRAFNKDSFAMKELFGPVLHVVPFRRLEEAVQLFNATEYGLTGGIFSQSQDDIDYLSSHLESGNIYINRSITGARVAIEPFGGFKLSGTGPKAGSRSTIETMHLNPINLPVLTKMRRPTPVDEKGEDYLPTPCRPSGLPAEMRITRVSSGLDILLQNFESLYQGIYGENKTTLRKFQRWLEKDGLAFLQTGFPNRSIPGQVNISRIDLNQGKLVVLGHEERAHFSTLMEVIGALALGLGVSVLCRNKTAYGWWSNVMRFMHQGGISPENLDVFFASEEVARKIICSKDIGQILIDGNEACHSKWLPEIFNGLKNETQMKIIRGPYDAPAVGHYERYLSQFAKIRAFAINTMRHGAPLELDI